MFEAKTLFGAIVFAIVLGLIMSYPAMLLWNGCLVPAIDGVKEVGWLQTWGLTILSNLMFKTTVSSK